jgi:membrane-associated phospholipid phosphatase
MNHSNGLLKLFYHQPRPYWVSDNIRAYKCSKEYGFPSGHSSISMHITVLMILDIFASSAYSNEIFIQIIVLILSISFPVLIGFSRVYLGVHSLD